MWDDEEYRNKVIEHLEDIKRSLTSIAASLERLAKRIDRDKLVPPGEVRDVKGTKATRKVKEM